MAWISHLKGKLSRARVYMRWLVKDVPKNPGYELTARRFGRADRKAFMADRKAGAVAVERNFAPFGQSDIPKVVWMYWHQGEQDAPFIVRRCIESWRRCNPGWDIRVLDAQSVHQYADISDVPDVLPFRFSANLLRVRLLKDHGGIWADATVYCHRPLDDWVNLMTTTGFFALRHPGAGRWISSWFLISAPGHVLPAAWEAVYGPYVQKLRSVPDMYFVFFYLFQWRLKHDPEAMAAWTRAPSLPAQPSLMMMQVLRGHLPELRLREVVHSGTPVSKLTWKENLDETAFDALCGRLEEVKAD